MWVLPNLVTDSDDELLPFERHVCDRKRLTLAEKELSSRIGILRNRLKRDSSLLTAAKAFLKTIKQVALASGSVKLAHVQLHAATVNVELCERQCRTSPGG